MERKSNIGWRWIQVMSAALVVTLLFASFTGISTAFADDGVEPTRGERGGHLDERLEACLDKANEWYGIQDENVGKANTAADRVEDGLAKAAEMGIDTTSIEALMPALYAAIGQAEAAHARAEQIISEHAGYNGDGKVIDRQQALETCKAARDALSSARDSLLTVREKLREIFQEFKDLRGSQGRN